MAARANLLGGFVIRANAAALPVTANQATRNHGSGLILEKGLAAESYTGNSISQNSDPQVFTGADLATGDEPEPAKPR